LSTDAHGPESDVRMPLTAHLEELRTRLVRALLAVAAGFALAYLWAAELVTFLTRPLVAQGMRVDVIGTGVTDAFFTKLKVSAIAGVFLASPVVFYQVWRFVSPGLYAREKRVALPFSVTATVFFFAGAAFCYVVVFPVAFRFFLEQFATIALGPQIRISEYLTFSSRMLLAFGVTFELPVASFFLARIGVITHRTLLDAARYAVVGIFVVAAVLTPGPDIASQLLMAAPLLVLYVLSIAVAWAVAAPSPADEPANE
jgi:sec-independent protein translocase protein TatC